jgi:CheY-like chemotaxis protein
MLQTTEKPARISQRATALPIVVLIEDNPDDIRLIRLALDEAGLHVNVQVAEGSTQAFELMGKLPRPPAVVVLDLNLPLVKGEAILREIRNGGAWNDVPVIVLTSSQAERDIDACLKFGASAFKSKPPLFDGYVEFARSLVRYL